MALRIDEESRRLEVSVGDLVPAEDVDPFAPTRASFARMQAGTRAHVAYAKEGREQDPDFEAEVVVRGELVVEGWTVAVSGRVDGLRRSPEEIVVEEVKTVILTDAAFAALHPESYPAYLLQLRLYLFLLAHDGDVEHLRGRLIFINLPGKESRAFDVELDRDEVRKLLIERVREILDAWRQERQRLRRRRALGAELVFPFAERRPHQADMEEECLRAMDSGSCLLVSAPPGLGKTAAALSAGLRHGLSSDRRVFFVTSKTTEQRVVTSTLRRLVDLNDGLTAVVLRAKAKICANDVVFCHPEFCEYARDYPSKVRTFGSRERLLEIGLAVPDEVYAEGLRARACPFELSLDLTESADVVVGDYNYVFDPAIALNRTFDDAAYRDLVLVIDEAHNLIDRAREYYSPHLDSARVREVHRLVEVRPGDIYREIEDWLGSLLRWFASLLDEIEHEEPMLDPADGRPSYPVVRAADAIRRRRRQLEEILMRYTSFRRESGGIIPDDPILDLTYRFLRFARVMELEGDEFVYLLEPSDDGELSYRIVCLDPAPWLRQRLEGFHSVIAMSATLEPEAYYRELLGFPPDRTASIRVPSPFAAENRRVLVVPTVDTTFRQRERWYDRVADTVREIQAARPGHWVTFFPSFAYLREIEARIRPIEAELLVQEPSMADAERAAILARLERPDGSPRLLLGVLGGSFAEGIDLPGEALVGVIVVSPGLPRVSLERELLRRRFDELYGSGFDYAYLLPGLSRVVQAAGRLVRGTSDRGVVVLLDRRFGRQVYSRHFPRDWYLDDPRELVVREPAVEVERFFAGR